LRRWQIDGLRLWESSGHRGCVEVATGGGKTTFAWAAFAAARRARPDTRLVVVVPTTALLDQWEVSAQTDAGYDASDVKVLSSIDLIPSALVNVVVINTARGFAAQNSLPDDLMMVVDECHRAGSSENSKALTKGPWATLGLSATPYRDFDDGFQRYVEPRLGPVILRYSIDDALRDGVLAPLSLTYIKIPLTTDEKEEYEALSRRIGIASAQGDSEKLERLLRTRARLYNSAKFRLPVTRAVLDENRGRRALCFLESISQASELVAQLNSDGHSVAIYHSQMTVPLRQSNLRAFRRGVFDILVACRALDEGFNVPEAQLAIITAGTSSRRQRVQRFGRVLRSIAGKELAQVISLYATPVEEQRFLLEAEGLDASASVSWKEAKIG
jgi:superfamily II DNA or RNA helicase